MKRSSLFSGSRNRNVPASSRAQSEPNASADMHNTDTRERSSPSSILAGMLSPALISHSSNHTRSPSARSRSAKARTTTLSFELWLRNTSNWKWSAMYSPNPGAPPERQLARTPYGKHRPLAGEIVQCGARPHSSLLDLSERTQTPGLSCAWQHVARPQRWQSLLGGYFFFVLRFAFGGALINSSKSPGVASRARQSFSINSSVAL